MSSEESAENSRKNNVGEKGIKDEGLEEKEDEKDACGVNFECNICLDLAEEPVVTSCGHLFCWPCLYQWLHLHCSHSECPVCKGEVIEATITPVYGRGNAGSKSQKGRKDVGDSGLKIPQDPVAGGSRAGGRGYEGQCREGSAWVFPTPGGAFWARSCRGPM
ncbi:unnamed protein product [Spirodela intermedia]|uniref:E3 ubiquitin-protein ligase RMA n=1 Tax=Spirodela intermedia TaxID=51605 RepID=A0A7I8JI18_SPIIN|nr:unnamed protein product [Spirodela intermedia]CAA6669571.1 unnamed protein product [Spirodela intermedia]